MFKIVHINNLPKPKEILTEKEIGKYNSFKIEKRRKEWLGGRFAAKLSIIEKMENRKRKIMKEKSKIHPSSSTLHVSPFTKIEITYDKYGRPIWESSDASILHPSYFIFLLSISHSGEYAVATSCPLKPVHGGVAKNGNCNFLGIDIEKIEQRHPLWTKDYFHTIEVTKATAEFHTELWTKKEALLKALGLGLKADPLDIIIKDKIKFLNKAKVRYKELGEPKFTIKTTKFENYIISLAKQKL